MLKIYYAPCSDAGSISKVSPKNSNPMYEQFIELTDQLFWEGYAEQLAKDDPARFQFELNDFLNAYPA